MCAQWVGKDPDFLHADSENSYQTGRMSRLIRVFAGRTCHFLSFFHSFFDTMYICISLNNYAVIKQVLSWKQCISFFSLNNGIIRRGRGDYEYGAEVTRGRPD